MLWKIFEGTWKKRSRRNRFILQRIHAIRKLSSYRTRWLMNSLRRLFQMCELKPTRESFNFNLRFVLLKCGFFSEWTLSRETGSSDSFPVRSFRDICNWIDFNKLIVASILLLFPNLKKSPASYKSARNLCDEKQKFNCLSSRRGQDLFSFQQALSSKEFLTSSEIQNKFRVQETFRWWFAKNLNSRRTHGI